MLSSIDEWLGKILEQCNLNNTLIVITSDHGDYIPVVDTFGQIPRIQAFMKKGKDIFPQFGNPIWSKNYLFYSEILL